MALQIAQDYEYRSDDHWKWSVWLEGTEEELDQVDAVEYHLHPTFPNPVRVVDDRAGQFRLTASGWGVFKLEARVRHTDGSVTPLSHMLELAYPDEEMAPEKPATRGEQHTSRKRSVFLSAGTADSAIASELRTQLQDRGVDVWGGDDLASGAVWESEIERAIRSTDAVVAVTSDVPSKWVEREVGAATQFGATVIPVVVGDNAVGPKGL
ncbi:MAG: TIR domain-containing protein, partial [Acidimicrobiia bacterium]|nr:TIR domain-containing protein [Acidimicrobiia bacterium]